MTIDEFIDSKVEGDDLTSRLTTIKALRSALDAAWVGEGRRLAQMRNVSWVRIGAAVGMSAKLASFHFGEPVAVARWKQNNREAQARRRASLKKVA